MPRRRRQPANVSEALLTDWTQPRVEALYAIVVRDVVGNEAIARRHTQIGQLPLITDDPNLVERMRDFARESYLEASIQVAKFARVEDIRVIQRPSEPVPDPGPAPSP
jgi:hypothetical protein